MGNYEGFVLGASTLRQLADAGMVPSRSYGRAGNTKPDGLVVDLRDATAPLVKLVIEHKDAGVLSTPERRRRVFDKAVSVYCKALRCPLVAITDGSGTWWAVADPADWTWRFIAREDGFWDRNGSDRTWTPGGHHGPAPTDRRGRRAAGLTRV